MLQTFTSSRFLFRWLVALTLVFGLFNARGVSFYHVLEGDIELYLSVQVLIGLVLFVLAYFCIHSTLTSIGWLGALVVAVFIAVFIWVLSDYEVVKLTNDDLLLYAAQVLIALVLAVGMSWRRNR